MLRLLLVSLCENQRLNPGFAHKLKDVNFFSADGTILAYPLLGGKHLLKVYSDDRIPHLRIRFH